MARNFTKIRGINICFCLLSVFLFLFNVNIASAAKKIKAELNPKEEKGTFIGIVGKSSSKDLEAVSSQIQDYPAQEENLIGVLVSPAKLEVTFIPREYVNGYIYITNNTAKSIYLKLDYEWIFLGSGFYTSPYFEPEEFNLEPGQTRDVYYSIGGPIIVQGGGEGDANSPLIGESKLRISVDDGAGVVKNLGLPIEVKSVSAPPDIIVSDLVFNPSAPKKNQPFTVTAIVKNLQHGLETISEDNCKDTGRFNAKWYVGNTVVWSTQHNNLKAGTQSKSPVVTLKFPKGKDAGTYEISFAGDVDYQVAEFDETNNSFTKTVNILSASQIKTMPKGNSKTITHIKSQVEIESNKNKLESTSTKKVQVSPK